MQCKRFVAESFICIINAINNKAKALRVRPRASWVLRVPSKDRTILSLLHDAINNCQQNSWTNTWLISNSSFPNIIFFSFLMVVAPHVHHAALCCIEPWTLNVWTCIPISTKALWTTTTTTFLGKTPLSQIRMTKRILLSVSLCHSVAVNSGYVKLISVK